MNTTVRQPLCLLCAFACVVLPGALACGAGGREHSCTGASEVIPGEGGYLIPGLSPMAV